MAFIPHKRPGDFRGESIAAFFCKSVVFLDFRNGYPPEKKKGIPWVQDKLGKLWTNGYIYSLDHPGRLVLPRTGPPGTIFNIIAGTIRQYIAPISRATSVSPAQMTYFRRQRFGSCTNKQLVHTLSFSAVLCTLLEVHRSSDIEGLVVPSEAETVCHCVTAVGVFFGSGDHHVFPRPARK